MLLYSYIFLKMLEPNLLQHVLAQQKLTVSFFMSDSLFEWRRSVLCCKLLYLLSDLNVAQDGTVTLNLQMKGNILTSDTWDISLCPASLMFPCSCIDLSSMHRSKCRQASVPTFAHCCVINLDAWMVFRSAHYQLESILLYWNNDVRLICPGINGYN